MSEESDVQGWNEEETTIEMKTRKARSSDRMTVMLDERWLWSLVNMKRSCCFEAS